MKKGHQIYGSLLYLICKINCILGLILNADRLSLVLGFIWIVITILLRIYLEIRHKLNEKVKTDFPKKQSIMKKEYEELMGYL